MICAIWSMPNLSNHFTELIRNVDGITWCSTGDDVYQYLKDNYGIESLPVIAGVSFSDFYPTQKPNQLKLIKRLGLNGIPFVNYEWDKIKRPQMLVDIANGIGGKPVFIHGKNLNEANTMYDDIDMYICTSTNDRGPYGIAEATFCKIPVISTKTGLALRFKSIKTFDTVDEAVEIINEFNKNPEKLNSYIEEVYQEITENMNWDYVSKKYWLPVFEQHQSLTLNKK